MPTEMRHLLFRPPEVLVAVKEYHRRVGTPLPAGSVARCGPEAVGADAAVRFRIVLTPDPSTDPTLPSLPIPLRRELVIEPPVLAAALILHCRDRRIPLPASAGKSLQRFGEQVCLVVTINPKQDDMPAADQLCL